MNKKIWSRYYMRLLLDEMSNKQKHLKCKKEKQEDDINENPNNIISNLTLQTL